MASVARIVGVATLAALVGVAAGCGQAETKGPKRFPFSGRVTFKGEPVKTGEIVFGATDPKKSTSANATIKDGAFTVDKGLAEGDYVVVVTSYKRPIQDIPPKELATIGDSNLAVPKKYTSAATSSLRLMMTPETKSKDFDLTD